MPAKCKSCFFFQQTRQLDADDTENDRETLRRLYSQCSLLDGHVPLGAYFFSMKSLPGRLVMNARRQSTSSLLSRIMSLAGGRKIK